MPFCATSLTSRAELAGRSSQSSARVPSHELDRSAVAGPSILPSARERERRCGLELILRYIDEGVVRIRPRAGGVYVGFVRRRVRASRGPVDCVCGSSRYRRGAGARLRCGQIHPADLAIGYRYVMLTQAKETTCPNYHGLKPSALINDEFGDAADLLVFIVVDIEADQLGGTPLTGGFLGHPFCRGHGGCR